MSDSGRQVGDCQHGYSPSWCCYCLQERVAQLEAENAALHEQLQKFRSAVAKAVPPKIAGSFEIGSGF